MTMILRVLGLALFAVVLIALEVNAFPGPWVWSPAQILLVLFAIVIIGAAVIRRTKAKS